MSKDYALSLHIFRRDLRLADNTSLINALRLSEKVIPIFIFDPRQIKNNSYKSKHCLTFMFNSLQELSDELKIKNGKLFFFAGQAEKIVAQIIKQLKIDAVFINRDYTPFSRERDKKIADLCQTHDINFHSFADALLHEPEQILKPIDHKPYTIFTYFYKKAAQLEVAQPERNLLKNYYTNHLPGSDPHLLNEMQKAYAIPSALQGGRKEGLQLLRRTHTLTNYAETRNIPSLDGTSKLSAHNKFGTLSIREIYYNVSEILGKHHDLIKELFWRDFFTHIGFHFPHVFEHAFQTKYQKIKWRENEKFFKAWCDGETGFPIVDAGMRELNETGYMHNRVRMITASFLTKDLQIDWRKGEKYFAQQLIDYDPAVNNGNWQWAASTGCDAQPYFRIFNPWLQQKKFDPDCTYIKKFIPALQKIPAKILHTLNRTGTVIQNYPAPLVNHDVASKKAKLMYKI